MALLLWCIIYLYITSPVNRSFILGSQWNAVVDIISDFLHGFRLCARTIKYVNTVNFKIRVPVTFTSQAVFCTMHSISRPIFFHKPKSNPVVRCSRNVPPNRDMPTCRWLCCGSRRKSMSRRRPPPPPSIKWHSASRAQYLSTHSVAVPLRSMNCR